MGRGTWGLQSMGSQKSRTRLKRLSTDTCRQEMTAFASYIWVTKKEKKKKPSNTNQIKANKSEDQASDRKNKTKKKKKQEAKKSSLKKKHEVHSLCSYL